MDHTNEGDTLIYQTDLAGWKRFQSNYSKWRPDNVASMEVAMKKLTPLLKTDDERLLSLVQFTVWSIGRLLYVQRELELG